MDGRSKAAQRFHSPLSKNFPLLLATSHVWQVVSRNTTQALEARPFCLLARYIFVHIVYNKNNCLMNKELHSLFLLFFPLSLHLHQNKVCLHCQALLVRMQSNLNCVFLILHRDKILFHSVLWCTWYLQNPIDFNPGVWKLLPSPLALLMHPIPHNWE